MPNTTAGRNALLDSGIPAFTHVGAFTDLGSTEVAGGSYARQATTWNAASSGTKTNSNAPSIPIPAGTTVVTLGQFSASVAGSTYSYLPYGSSGQLVKGVGTVDVVASDTIKSAGHGLVADDRVFFWAVNGESLPTGLSAATLYWVRSTGLTADVFTVSTTQGGAAVDITGLGEVAFAKTVPNTFASAGNINISAGSLTNDATFA